MKNNYFVQAWLVIALSLAFGAALAAVDKSLAGKIEQNKLADTRGQIPALVPGATGGEDFTVDGKVVYRALDAGGKQVGWVIPATGQGFADVIELLIGLDAKAQTITGVYVLAQKETPCLGDNITKPPFTGQFPGKNTAAPLEIVKGQAAEGTNQVQAVSGATVSSTSVAGIVNDTVTAWRDKLAAAAK